MPLLRRGAPLVRRRSRQPCRSMRSTSMPPPVRSCRATRVSPSMNAHRFITGFHFIQFDHWSLRWIYFVLGPSGCALIATGFLFWLESRRRRHAQPGLRGVPVVEGLAVGSVSGIVIATLAFFVANWLLPPGASASGVERRHLEVWTFYIVWLLSFAHAWLRPPCGMAGTVRDHRCARARRGAAQRADDRRPSRPQPGAPPSLGPWRAWTRSCWQRGRCFSSRSVSGEISHELRKTGQNKCLPPSGREKTGPLIRFFFFFFL